MAALNEEFVALYNQEQALKEQLKHIASKRKELEQKIAAAMADKGVTSMQVGESTIVASQRRSKKAVANMAEQLAKEVKSDTESVKKAIEKIKGARPVEIKTSLKPIPGHI